MQFVPLSDPRAQQYLQQADPMAYKAYMENAQQPGAQLNETNAATGRSVADTASTNQDIAIKQRQLQQQQFVKEAQTLFDKTKDKSGYIAPDIYNKTKQAATQLGIGGDAFDATFGKAGYVNPQKVIDYNTSEGLANQQAYGQIKRQIQAQLDQYTAIPKDQKGLISKAEVQGVPFLGQLLAPHAYTYEQGRKGLSAQLKSIAGAGAGSGVRVNDSEMEKWANLIPSATDTATIANDKLTKLNDEIKATFNVSDGLDSHYLPSKGRAPLSSFTK